MAITRYRYRSPWAELDEISNRLGRMFEGGTNGMSWSPAVNVEERDEELLLTAELPGMSEDDVEIEIENNVLTISGEKRHEREQGEEEGRVHVWERVYGAFQRSFTLPRTVEAEDISAEFRNGVLSIRMPKSPQAKPRRIEVRSSTQVGSGESR